MKTNKVSKAELLERAKLKTPRLPDGSFAEDTLEDSLVGLIELDESDKRRMAKAIIDSQCTVGQTPFDGQLSLPGFPEYPYEPERMVRDDDGKIIEQDKAYLRFKFAEHKRSRQNATAAVDSSNRKAEEVEIFAKWTVEQTALGRPQNELTWGNCVRELGLRRDGGFAMPSGPQAPSPAPPNVM